MGYISDATWTKFRKIINGVHDDFNQDRVLWRRSKVNRSITQPVQRFNEQEQGDADSYENTILLVLVAYNYFRTWPITKQTETGELDNQNMSILINKKYLVDLGYITPQGYFDFQPDKDYFIHRGIKYKCEGDSLISQAKDDPLLVQIILHREETLTGEDRHNMGLLDDTFDEFFGPTFHPDD